MGKLCIEAAPWRAKAVFIDVLPYCQHAVSLFMCILFFLEFTLNLDFVYIDFFIFFRRHGSRRSHEHGAAGSPRTLLEEPIFGHF